MTDDLPRAATACASISANLVLASDHVDMAGCIATSCALPDPVEIRSESSETLSSFAFRAEKEDRWQKCSRYRIKESVTQFRIEMDKGAMIRP